MLTIDANIHVDIIDETVGDTRIYGNGAVMGAPVPLLRELALAALAADPILRRTNGDATYELAPEGPIYGTDDCGSYCARWSWQRV